MKHALWIGIAGLVVGGAAVIMLALHESGAGGASTPPQAGPVAFSPQPASVHYDRFADYTSVEVDLPGYIFDGSWKRITLRCEFEGESWSGVRGPLVTMARYEGEWSEEFLDNPPIILTPDGDRITAIDGDSTTAEYELHQIELLSEHDRLDMRWVVNDYELREDAMSQLSMFLVAIESLKAN